MQAMATDNEKTIQYINLGDGEGNRPIDAVTVGRKSAEAIGTLVTSIDSTSTDTQYPSAKCVYDLVGTLENRLKNI